MSARIDTGRGPLGLKGDKPAKAERKPMRRTAQGKRASHDDAIMRSARDEPCLADWCGCGGSTETTHIRHIRKFGIAGTAQKPPNLIAFYGCDAAERAFENTAKPTWTWQGLMQAMVLTQMKLIKKGLLIAVQ